MYFQHYDNAPCRTTFLRISTNIYIFSSEQGECASGLYSNISHKQLAVTNLKCFLPISRPCPFISRVMLMTNFRSLIHHHLPLRQYEIGTATMRTSCFGTPNCVSVCNNNNKICRVHHHKIIIIIII